MARRRRMAPRVRRYAGAVKRRASKITIPLGLIGGLMGTIAVRDFLTVASKGDAINAVKQFSTFAGVYPDTGKFNMQLLIDNSKPLIAGIIAHKAAGMLGLNKYLAAAKVPILRI